MLIGIGNEALIAGIVVVPLAICFALYALARYQWRAHHLRQHKASGYDDRVGPICLM